VDTAYKRLHIVGSDVFTFVVENAYQHAKIPLARSNAPKKL
jgi:hypothetical protein